MILAEGIAHKYQPEIPIMGFDEYEALRHAAKLSFGAAATGLRNLAMMNDMGAALMPMSPLSIVLRRAAHTQRSGADFMDHYLQDVERIPLNFDNFTIDAQRVNVTEETVHETPFGHLTHLKRQRLDGQPIDRHDPPLIVFVPHSGHRVSLTQDFMRYFAHDHDVYYVEMNDANEIPVAAGEFGYHDAIDFYRACMVHAHRHAAANGHKGRVHAGFICQPGPPAFIAAMTLADENAPERPASIAALASPFDTRINPTVVNHFAAEHDMDWFERKVIQKVPHHYGYAGEGRMVYPGHIQRAAFIAKNMGNHVSSAMSLWADMLHRNEADVERRIRFNKAFLHDISSLTAAFYRETVRHGFKEHTLARGQFVQNGKPVTGAENKDIPVLAIEGAQDDITGLEQCRRMLDFCVNLPARLKSHLILPKAGHYGVFAGSGLKKHSGPAIAGFIRQHDQTDYSARAQETFQESQNSAVFQRALAA